MFQNAINKQNLGEMTKEVSDVIFKYHCVPNCVKKHVHNYMYDYSKCYKDPIRSRPGECHDADQDKTVKCSPINLETGQEIYKDFRDDQFKFNYETVDPKASYKFNQAIESYSFPIKRAKKAGNNMTSFNYMNTATISLFDKHIPRADFFGQQFHFHSPSEHSIDGKLMDLELHIVHFIDDKLSPGNAKASQFFAGVLGFLFKVMPDSYFEQRKVQNPDILYHD